MNALFKKQAAEPLPAFTPGDDIEPRQSGNRRAFERVEALPLRWPTTQKERFDLFDAWHQVAMQILHRERGSFRLMAVAKLVIRWSPGVIIDSNAELAEKAGGCSEKTISRDVQDYIDLGVLVGALQWKRPGGGKFITVRTLRPSLPIQLPDGIILPETVPLSLDNSGPDLGGVSLDNSGPDLGGVSLDNSGPGGLDNSGPATIDHKKGGGDAA